MTPLETEDSESNKTFSFKHLFFIWKCRPKNIGHFVPGPMC